MTRRVLFNVNHPAHVHLFRNAIERLQSRGHEVLVTSRGKEMTAELLDGFGIDHHLLTTEGETTAGLVTEFAHREGRLYSVARDFGPDVVVSRLSPPAVHVSTLLGARNLVYFDTVLRPPLVRALYYGATLPFVDEICTPPGFDLPIPVQRRHMVDFQELAYLHPNVFEPDPDRLRKHGVNPEQPYSVVRLAGWDAYHDITSAGLDDQARTRLVDRLATHGEVYITSEQRLPERFREYRLTVPPHHVHDLLAFADLYVGDSQTMPTEAAILGTPAVRVNSVVGDQDMHNFLELEDEYGLLFSYESADEALERAEMILSGDENLDSRRQQLLSDKMDVTAHMVECILGTDGAGSVRDIEAQAVSDR